MDLNWIGECPKVYGLNALRQGISFRGGMGCSVSNVHFYSCIVYLVMTCECLLNQHWPVRPPNPNLPRQRGTSKALQYLQVPRGVFHSRDPS